MKAALHVRGSEESRMVNSFPLKHEIHQSNRHRSTFRYIHAPETLMAFREQCSTLARVLRSWIIVDLN